MFAWLTPFSNIFVLFVFVGSLLVAAKDLFLLYAIGQGDIVHNAHDLEKHFDPKKKF